MINLKRAMIKATWYQWVMVSLACFGSAQADVILNEIGASSDSRTIRWNDDRPQLGAGYAWWEAAFDASQWWTGQSPLGMNRPDLKTDVSSFLSGKAPSLYLRKTFPVSNTQAASSRRLLLEIDFNDGFIAYLNGEEVARSRMGPINGFAYADQPSMSARSTDAEQRVYDLGEAKDLLEVGENLLAIQVHNESNYGDLLAQATLTFEGAMEIHSESFDSAQGDSRTHERNGNSVSNTAQGSPANGGWLDEAPDPQSDNSWSDLVIVTEEDDDIGYSSIGALRYTLTSDDSLEDAAMFSPEFELGSEWSSGNITAADLANTTLSFAALLPENFEIGVSVAAADGTGPILTGFPTLSRADTSDLIGHWRFDDSGVSDGDSMDGTVNALNPGTLDGYSLGSPDYSDDVPGPIIYDPVANVAWENNYSMDCRRSDARLAIPNGAALNTESFTIEFFIKLIGEPGSFESIVRRTTGTGDALSSTRMQWKIAFDHSFNHFGKIRQQWDTPGTPPLDHARITRGEHIWVDTDSGNGDPYDYGDGDPANDGNGVNDDTRWHHIAMTFDGSADEARFYTDGHPTESLILNGVYMHPDDIIQIGKFGNTYDMLIDEVRYTGRALRPDEFLTTSSQSSWRQYQLNLGEATGQSAFLDHLNNNNLTDIRLIFNVLESSYDADSKSFVLDDLSLSYNDLGFPASLVGQKDTWRYFPGLMEPSGGVYDTAMVADPLVKNEFSDWVELYNDGSSEVDLSGWTLTDDASSPNQWTFPAGTALPAGDYLLVLADDLETLTNPNLLHANFKLSESGEYVGLFNASGQLQSEIAPEYPTQYSYASYGRSSEDDTLGYLEMPTPGQANIGPALSDRVDAPDFDVKGGFYDSSVTVTLTSETPGALIRYTQDGTEPTLTNGTSYSGPITVTKLSSSSGRMIRARAFLDGQLPSKSKTHTYLIDQDPQLRSAPALVFAADLPRNLYKPHGPLAIEGGTYINDEWVATNDEDYNHALFRGRAFERPIHLEYYFTDGTSGFRTDAGVRIAASNSARPEIVLQHLDESPWRAEKREKPSFNVYFREDYGNDAVTFPLNGDAYPVDRFEQLRIRAGKNDSKNPFIIDEWVRRLYVEMGQIGSRGAITSLYVNGDYKGNYNTVERLREPFFNEHYGFPGSTDWDVLQAGNLNEIASGDRIAWNAMLALMNGPISESNWNAILDMADVVNMADYYLLNIYMGMWDWPNNNWVAARARIPEGRYRFYVWDAEGAINENGDKRVNYDTIDDDLNSGDGDVEICWQALNRWPEFRLLFADRIQKHLFNGGVLDDQDFDNSTLKRFYDNLESEFSDLLDYRLGDPVDRDALEDWVDPSNGRRNYLFGPYREGFRNNDLWPDAEPVSFNQHGGMVAPGFTVTISHGEGSSSNVYYTLDGTDPRAYGDAVSSSALEYPSGGITLSGAATTILSRVRKSNGEWSPLTEATFLAGTEPPSANNLVVAEIHYHPADNINDTSIDKDDYEYIQLLNIGNVPIDLTGIRFDGSAEGIEFIFPDSALAPGDYALLVKDQILFESRYGSGYTIRGEYSGRLSNGGEQLTLRDRSGAIIHQFAYGDDAPWPNLADGFGRALRLRNPETAPDPSDPANWMASPVYHGTPGGVIPNDTFSDWQAAHFTVAELSDPAISGPLADPDGDGMGNLVEYGLGTLPRAASQEEAFSAGDRVAANGEIYLGLTYSVATNATDLQHVVEVSNDHDGWNTDSVEDVEAPIDHNDGRMTYFVRDSVPFSEGTRRFLRIRFIQE